MLKVVLFLVIAAAETSVIRAADINSQNWLASRSAPPCSVKPGVRASRSDLVRFADISASISAQSTRDESGGCEQSASIWVTKDGVSRQVDLADAAVDTFSIIDFAPDASYILLYREKTFAVPGEDAAPEISLLPLNGKSLIWVPVKQVIGWKNCSGLAEPEGFQGPRRIVFKASLVAGVKSAPACVDRPKALAFDFDSKKTFELPSAPLKLNGHRLSGPLLSCQSDPDVVAACYNMRGKVALGANGVSMRLWQTETGKLMNLGEGMLPDELSSQVRPGILVYADMLICPMKSSSPKTAPPVCIESAGNLQRERMVPKQALAKAAVSPAAAEQGASH